MHSSELDLSDIFSRDNIEHVVFHIVTFLDVISCVAGANGAQRRRRASSLVMPLTQPEVIGVNADVGVGKAATSLNSTAPSGGATAAAVAAAADPSIVAALENPGKHRRQSLEEARLLMANLGRGPSTDRESKEGRCL